MRQSLAISILLFGLAKPSTGQSPTNMPVIALSSILSTSTQEGMLRPDKAIQNENPHLRQILASKGGSSDLFLVDATNIEDAVRASSGVLVGSRTANIPAPVNTADPERGSHWLVVFLGSAGSDPPRWVVESAVVAKSRVRFTYRTRRPGPETADAHRYYYWIPLGTLKPGDYQLELYDAELKAVTLMRRVNIERPSP